MLGIQEILVALSPVLFGALVAYFAARKNRSKLLWFFAGAITQLIALFGLAFFHDLKKLPLVEQEKSVKRERIFCITCILIGIVYVVSILLYVLFVGTL